MKTICYVRNLHERVETKALLGSTAACYPSSEQELTNEILVDPPASILILDERFGDLRPMIECALARSPESAPLFVILVNERDATAENWAPMEERVEYYTGRGAELFLHRPFGMMAFKECIEKALTWAQSPPAWVQLMRAARTLVKTQEAERVLTGLQTLHVKLPRDQNVGVLYVRALQSCTPPRNDEALTVLQNLLQWEPENPILLRSIFDVCLSLDQLEDAAMRGLKLCQLRPNIENTKLLQETFAKIQKVSPDATTWQRLFNSVPSTACNQLRTLRSDLVKYWARANHKISDANVFVRTLKGYPEFVTALADELMDFFARIEVDPQQAAKDPERATVMQGLLEYLLDAKGGNPRALLKFVQLQVARGDVRSAESRLRRARVVNSVSFEYHVGMAVTALAQGDPQAASRFCENAERLTGDTQSRKSTLAALRAEVEQALRTNQKAG